jgi:hypothetical protein
MLQRSVDFLLTRTAGDPPRNLSDIYGEGSYIGEVTYEDHFHHAYVGKVYEGSVYMGREATEVTSMVVQHLGDVAKLAEIHRHDPDLVDLVLGNLAGYQ